MKKCQMELGNGHTCQKPATIIMAGLPFCDRHAKMAKPLFRSNVKITKIKN